MKPIMTQLRVGLCPTLTQETLDALKTGGIKTGI